MIVVWSFSEPALRCGMEAGGGEAGCETEGTERQASAVGCTYAFENLITTPAFREPPYA